MAVVYSYVRFSSKKQADGDSLRRQVDVGQKWIEKHGHTLARMRLRDLGRSGFHGDNLKEGAGLARFLDAIKTGRVQPGSILLVEALDRLSRQGVSEAYTLFQSILSAGVDIVCIYPFEMRFSRDNVNDLIGLLIPIIAFHVAHIESQQKSQRVGEYQSEQRKNIRQGKPIDRKRPSWIDYDEENGVFVLNDGVRAVRCIFEKKAEGLGNRQILRHLNATFKPIGRSRRWNESFLQSVLTDRTVLGERQPCRLVDKKQVPDGPVVKGYYPAAVDEGLWYRAQAMRDKNRRKKGPSGQFVNLFTGLLFNGFDKSAMHVETTRQPRDGGKKYVQRRLVSWDHKRKVPGACGVSVDYFDFERAILTFLRDVDPAELERVEDKRASRLREAEQELTGVEVRLREIREAMTRLNVGNVETLVATVAEVDGQRGTLNAEVERLRAELHAERSLEHAKSVLGLLDQAEGEELQTLRFRLRGLVDEVVERVTIYPHKVFGRVQAVAAVKLHATETRFICFDGDWCQWNVVLGEGDVEDDTEDTVWSLLSRLLDRAKRIAQPEPFEQPATLPSTLQAASEVWLKVARTRIKKGSFRVVPSKIQRFVGFVGDIGCDGITDVVWGRWKKFLRAAIRKGDLQRTTAHVTLNRSREFVRWLVESKLTAPLASLDGSAAKMLG